MARGKGKNCQKLKILAFLKLAYQKLSGNVQSRLDFSNVENGPPYSGANFNPKIMFPWKITSISIYLALFFRILFQKSTKNGKNAKPIKNC